MERRLFLASLLSLTADAFATHAAPSLLLANAYHDDIDVADYWISEKYDGIRGFWTGDRLLSRAGNPISAPGWFTAALPAIALDGELWIGRGEFESVTSTVRDAIPVDAAWRNVRFMIFDLPRHAGHFTQRLAELRRLFDSPRQTLAMPVPQVRVHTQDELFTMLRETTAAGGEGLVLHRGESAYVAGRSDDLLKLKLHEDAEARVVAHLPGKGKYQGVLGALRLERPDGVRFNLGTGFTDGQRRHPPAIGSWVTYTFHGTTARGLPRFASFLRERREPGGDAGN